MIDRRSLLKIALAAAAQRLDAAGRKRPLPHPRKLVLVTIGGIRRQETFSTEGVVNIPHLYNDLLPQALFYPYTVNEGVTSHFNTISSIITGAWEHLDDWGRDKPAHPTLFEYTRQQLQLEPADMWVVTSNKQVTSNISSDVNVILSKQLLIEAVERIITGQSQRDRLDRSELLEEMKAVLNTDYERIGWGVPSTSAFRDSAVKETFVSAMSEFIHGAEAPATGDELTFLIGREVLKKIAPTVLMMNFSDVEVAHVGSYALHLGGIRRSDALCHRLWQFIQSSPELQGRTTLVIMNEFGRDPDGSTTNGFFNHRTNTECCRLSWSLVLGPAIRKPDIVERTIRQIDMAPAIGAWLGVQCSRAQGSGLFELAV